MLDFKNLQTISQFVEIYNNYFPVMQSKVMISIKTVLSMIYNIYWCESSILTRYYYLEVCYSSVSHMYFNES